MSDDDRAEARRELREGSASPGDTCPEWPERDARSPSDLNDDYALFGVQVEPGAAWWLEPKPGGPIRVPTIDEVEQEVMRRVSPQDQRQQEQEEPLDRCPDIFDGELPGRIFPFFESQEELERDFDLLFNRFVRCRDQQLDPDRLSLFVNLQKQPFGALFNTTYDQFRVDRVLEQQDRLGRPGYEYVRTGAELARLFERETPGLYHHHALHWFLYERSDISPPRQARIWMALNLTIYAALSAAWYFKWAFNAANPGAQKVSFALRPYEYARDARFVLYDFRLDPSGAGSGGPVGVGPPMPPNCPSPGTPRHPAYPSGHSTYSAAASRILTYFFGDHQFKGTTAREELCKLADNIGEARLYAGVHWIRDHRFGQLVGTAVADLVIRQLREDCIQPVPPMPAVGSPPPSEQQIRDLRARPCDPTRMHDRIPDRGTDPDGKGLPPHAPAAT